MLFRSECAAASVPCGRPLSNENLLQTARSEEGSRGNAPCGVWGGAPNRVSGAVAPDVPSSGRSLPAPAFDSPLSPQAVYGGESADFFSSCLQLCGSVPKRSAVCHAVFITVRTGTLFPLGFGAATPCSQLHPDLSKAHRQVSLRSLTAFFFDRFAMERR